MKRIIVSLLAIAPTFAFAQFSKGNVFLGGSLSTLVQNIDNKQTIPSAAKQSTTAIGISPSIGFFLNEKIALGTTVSYSTNTQKYDLAGGGAITPSSSKLIQNAFGISSYIRYYMPISSSIYFGLQGGLSFSRGNQKNTVDYSTYQTTTETPMYTLAATVRPIFIFFPSPKWGIEASVASLGYSYLRDLPNVSSTSAFALSAGSLSFGINYYFIKK